jgi:hypothetical protein
LSTIYVECSIFRYSFRFNDSIEDAFIWSNNKNVTYTTKSDYNLRFTTKSDHKTHGGMGFKDLTTFNLTMLGKQGWKFQIDTNSLVSRILEAQYFPQGTYLTASLGHNPSYVWRSILQAPLAVVSKETTMCRASLLVPQFGV